MVMLVYKGGGLTRSFYGVSGTCYRFGGKARQFGWVKEEDVAGLLGKREGGKFVFTVDQPKAEPVKEVIVTGPVSVPIVVNVATGESIPFEDKTVAPTVAKKPAAKKAPAKKPAKKKSK
jgi:hypothetical protein